MRRAHSRPPNMMMKTDGASPRSLSSGVGWTRRGCVPTNEIQSLTASSCGLGLARAGAATRPARRSHASAGEGGEGRSSGRRAPWWRARRPATSRRIGGDSWCPAFAGGGSRCLTHCHPRARLRSCERHPTTQSRLTGLRPAAYYECWVDNLEPPEGMAPFFMLREVEFACCSTCPRVQLPSRRPTPSSECLRPAHRTPRKPQGPT